MGVEAGLLVLLIIVVAAEPEKRINVVLSAFFIAAAISLITAVGPYVLGGGFLLLKATFDAIDRWPVFGLVLMIMPLAWLGWIDHTETKAIQNGDTEAFNRRVDALVSPSCTREKALEIVAAIRDGKKTEAESDPGSDWPYRSRR